MSDMPESIRNVFDELREQIIWLHARWKIYRQLFAHSASRADLLNRSARVFFIIVHATLLDEIQLSFAKLTDPARTGKHENLSLDQLQERMEGLGDDDFSARLRNILDGIQEKCRVFRIRRNKRLAHFDLDTSLQLDAEPLPGVSMEMIEEMLGLAAGYMKAIEGHYYQHDIDFSIDLYSDADALVSKLQHGLRFEQLIKDEKIPSEELFGGEWSGA